MFGVVPVAQVVHWEEAVVPGGATWLVEQEVHEEAAVVVEYVPTARDRLRNKCSLNWYRKQVEDPLFHSP